jgi:hypothetical protein
MLAIRAHFDGKVLVPDEPVDLPCNQPLVLRVEMDGDPKSPASANLWDLLEKYSGSIEAPADWSSQHDHYIHGTPKRPNQDLK